MLAHPYSDDGIAGDKVAIAEKRHAGQNAVMIEAAGIGYGIPTKCRADGWERSENGPDADAVPQVTPPAPEALALSFRVAEV